jgi:hypothetical protein
MGLDAFVYCDCFERGQLREQPPAGCALSVSADGSLDCGSENLDLQIAFDRWQFSQACEHESGVLLHHRIGNIALVAELRTALNGQAGHYPLLLSKVLYNGTHSGDWLAVEEVKALQSELCRLVAALADKAELCRLVARSGYQSEVPSFLRSFAVQMGELVECALRVGKPLVF